eukprot:TRINITY_DN16565_c0_g1_i1.p3 TRINITY_DN16565_c0_g1~~TRINITY_DN16565_c0_g1_i1.p3  ORF type:complete len:55 (-),score=2.85 TRINITY_DN16565_c0_g1_i1:103-267(-)
MHLRNAVDFLVGKLSDDLTKYRKNEARKRARHHKKEGKGLESEDPGLPDDQNAK